LVLNIVACQSAEFLKVRGNIFGGGGVAFEVKRVFGQENAAV